jgi:hypothetical protein
MLWTISDVFWPLQQSVVGLIPNCQNCEEIKLLLLNYYSVHHFLLTDIVGRHVPMGVQWYLVEVCGVRKGEDRYW